jgi:hypothetical protein
MRGFRAAIAAVAALGLIACCCSGAWALESDQAKDVSVKDDKGSVNSGTLTLQTTKGETIAKVDVKNGKASIPPEVQHKIATEKKIKVVVYNGETGETSKPKKDITPAALYTGVDTAALASAAVSAVSTAAAVQTTNASSYLGYQSNFWVTLGGQLAFTRDNATGNFFGPGTGGGSLLTDHTGLTSFGFRGGVYTTFAPDLYGGLMFNVLTTPANLPNQFGMTPSGIAVTSRVVPSSPTFDFLGRVGYHVAGILGGERGFDLYVLGGAEWSRFNGETIAPSPGDFFIQSKTVAAPVAGAGFGFCGWTNGTCSAEVVVEYQFIDNHTSWFTGVTPSSSGLVSLGAENRVTVGVDIPLGSWGWRGPYGQWTVPSDVRLKHDIVQVGALANGLHLYRFRYDWSDQDFVGVMAQEVQQIMPDAVVPGPYGYLAVDYGKVGIELKTWEEFVAANPEMANLQ